MPAPFSHSSSFFVFVLVMFPCRLSLVAMTLCCNLSAIAQNPYLPLWEFIPDAEPYVFADPDNPGRKRVYVYGSHDTMITGYCGREQVVWSAPVEDLTAWRYDGVIFRSVTDAEGNLLRPDSVADVLYAPDVAVVADSVTGRPIYYLYPNNQASGRQNMVARSARPDGPFEVCNWNAERPTRTVGPLGFDPAVFVDDDGRVYGYWGFGESYAAELDPHTMSTVKPGADIIHNLIPGHKQLGVFRFFEASSMRKVGGKYIFIYSRITDEGESGLPSCNYNLAYAYADHPLGPFTYGGTIIDARAPGVDAQGRPVATAFPYGNTHGSILEVGGRWWVFYHRQTGTDEYSRQAMVAPLEVVVDGAPHGRVSISCAEVTSEGFMTRGLDPLSLIPGGIACFFRHPVPVVSQYPNYRIAGSYVLPVRNAKSAVFPVVNNTAGSVVGYKYLNFDATASATTVQLQLHLSADAIPDASHDAMLNPHDSIAVWLDAPSESEGGVLLGVMPVEQHPVLRLTALHGVAGKHALFFAFHSSRQNRSVGRLDSFRFVISE